MSEFFERLLSSDFIPQGESYLWHSDLLVLSVLSDSVLAIALFSIPLLLFLFLRRRKDLHFSPMLGLFGAFVILCAFSHLLGIWTVWVGTYRLAVLVKLLTALMSAVASVYVWRLIPQALEFPSPLALEDANRRLIQENLERESAEKGVRQLNEELESRILKATEELSGALARSQAAELRIAKQEERLRHLGDNLPGGAIYQILSPPGERGRFIYVSAGMEKQFGVPTDAILADPDALYSLIDVEDRPKVEAAEQAAKDAMQPYELQFRQRSRSGELKWILCRSAPSLQSDGSIIWDGVTLDITERIRAESEREAALEAEKVARLEAEGATSALRTLSEKNDRQYRIFDTILSSMNDQAYILDREGRFVYANRIVATTFELLTSDCVGRSLQEVGYPPDVEEQIRRDVSEVIRRKDIVVSVTSFDVPRLGTTYYENLLAPVVTDDGDVEVVVGISRDVTGRKQADMEREQLLEAERAARSELEKTARLKEEFLATLSHELRTPLNAILGWTQLIRRPTTSTDTLQQGLEIIERQTRIQAKLIEDLLDMSRITSGKLKIASEEVDVSRVIRLALDTLSPAAQKKGVELHFEQPPISSRVVGDPSRLQQVFWNLLSNSIKFTPTGGSISVIIRDLGANLIVDVTDTGQGIPQDFLSHIFERFRQVDGSNSRRAGGLGLGLSIAKHLTELHGGTVSVKSDGIGKGSTFSVELPTALVRGNKAGADGTLAISSSGTSRLQRIRILLVDDEPDAREFLKRLFEDEGAVVTVVGGAGEALARLDTQSFDTIVSDVGMPDMDGYEFLRIVRASLDPRISATPAVALTALARPEDKERAREAGFQLHTSKPVEPNEVISAVESLCHTKINQPVSGE